MGSLKEQGRDLPPGGGRLMTLALAGQKCKSNGTGSATRDQDTHIHVCVAAPVHARNCCCQALQCQVGYCGWLDGRVGGGGRVLEHQ